MGPSAPIQLYFSIINAYIVTFVNGGVSEGRTDNTAELYPVTLRYTVSNSFMTKSEGLGIFHHSSSSEPPVSHHFVAREIEFRIVCNLYARIKMLIN